MDWRSADQMKMPKKRYDFESIILYAFSCGLETGRKLSGESREEEIKKAKEQFCKEMQFIYLGRGGKADDIK